MTDERGTGDGQDVDVGGTRAEGVAESRPMIDDVFAVLADWRRREICQFFVETDADTATLEELAILVAGCRPASAPAGASHDDVKIALANNHLPKLADAGVVDFDSRSGTVRYWGHPTVEKWLEHVTAVDQRVE